MRQIKSLLILITATCILAGCSTSNLGTGNVSQSVALTTTSPEFIDIDRRLSELEAMKPGLMRLISIESDIKSLISELNTLADNYSGSPDGIPEEQSSEDDEIEYLSLSGLSGLSTVEDEEAEVEAPKTSPSTVIASLDPKQDTPPSSPQAPTKSLPQRASGAPSDFAVHLTSYHDSRNLLTGWNMLKKQFPSLLSKLTPKVEWISNASGESFLRLKAGPFATRGEAEQTCRTIRASDAYCAIMAYTGSNIEDFIIQ